MPVHELFRTNGAGLPGGKQLATETDDSVLPPTLRPGDAVDAVRLLSHLGNADVPRVLAQTAALADRQTHRVADKQVMSPGQLAPLVRTAPVLTQKLVPPGMVTEVRSSANQRQGHYLAPACVSVFTTK